MGLRFDPAGGGQFKEAVKQIMEAESRPVRQLEVRKGREETKLKLFQEFKGKFANIQKSLGEISSFKSFRDLKVDMGDGQNLASVTVDKDKAQPGTYNIQIDELAARTSVISNGFENPDEKELGIGFVVMNMDNGESMELFVDEENASLRGVANLINAQPTAPIRASVIQDASDSDAPWKLILTAKKDGKANSIEFPEFYFLDGTKDFYVDNDHPAQNARVIMDGFEVQLPSNDITDFLPGVNLHLKQARPDAPFTLTVTEDHQKISGKVKNFVDSMNDVLNFIVKQNTVDEKSDTRVSFAGDTGMQMIEYRFRNLLHEGFPVVNPQNGEYRLVFMNQVGVEFDKTGALKFNEEKFTKALESDFEGIAEAVTGSMGLAFQMREVVDGYVRGGNGSLTLREQGLRSRIKDIDNQIDRKTKWLETRQQAVTEQFARMEVALSNLQRQQNMMSASMGGGGGNIVSQLMG